VAYRWVAARSGLRNAVVAGVVCAIAVMTGLPILAAGTTRPDGCPAQDGEIDGTPTILGPATVTVAQLTAWWDATGRPQPPRLRVPVRDLVALYLSEGDLEGVRGDLALAQAIAETGYFTNTDTSRNNFAGIRHHDHAATGIAFPDAATGVRAHIQLLHKYAAGNSVALARPDVAPDAGARADTWRGLAGRWATSTTYWVSLSGVYASMLDHAAGDSDPALLVGPAPGGCGTAAPAAAGDYVLPVDGRWWDEHPEWFTKPHHDYPAADIPVPIGSPVYAVTAGEIVALPTGGKCGIGVVLNGGDGAQYSYCHGRPASYAVTIGEQVSAGQLLMLSASTGNSTGPHLHLGVRVGGQQRCPQPLLVSIAAGAPVDPGGLPAVGCTY
jgi:murein DD-endopeptidase MepM/ murein hydrolase activator NlpD